MNSVTVELENLAKESDALADLIYDVFNEKASNLNNSSVVDRVKFLLDSGVFKDESEIISYIKENEL